MCQNLPLEALNLSGLMLHASFRREVSCLYWAVICPPAWLAGDVVTFH